MDKVSCWLQGPAGVGVIPQAWAARLEKGNSNWDELISLTGLMLDWSHLLLGLGREHRAHPGVGRRIRG